VSKVNVPPEVTSVAPVNSLVTVAEEDVIDVADVVVVES